MADSTTSDSRPILAVVDLQSYSPQVVEHALLLAQRLNSSVLVLHVVHESAKSAGFYRRNDGGNHVLPMKEVAEKLLQQLIIEVIAEHAGETDLPQIRTLVVAGVPAGRIVEIAEREDVDTIVMVNDDCCGLERLWHGSVAEKVLKHTNRNMALLHQEIVTAAPLLDRHQETVSQALAS